MESRTLSGCLRRVLSLAVGLSLAGWADAESVRLVPVADTALWEESPGLNLGAQEDLPSGRIGPSAGAFRSRILQRFDLASVIPTGSRIRFAVLTVDIVREPTGRIDSGFGLHPMRTGWVEGTGDGVRPGGRGSLAGETDWNHARVPDVAWAAPGGLAGVDFETEPVSTAPVEGVGVVEFELGAAGVAVLQGWLERPETNLGWMLKSANETDPKTARRFAAREHPDHPPELRVEFLGPPRVVGLRLLEDSLWAVSFEAVRFGRYRLWATGSLGDVWRAVGEVIQVEDDGVAELVAPAVPVTASPDRFFRVERVD